MADAERILSKMLEKIAIEQNYSNAETKFVKLPCVGANFTSFLYEATISAKNKDDLKLFAKVAAVGKTMRAQAPVMVFKVEAHAYQSLLPKYQKLEEDHGLEDKDRLIIPKCYGINQTLFEETVVLEDLRAKGFKTLNRFELLNWEYATTSVTQLAKLHALSFAYAKEDPEGFTEDMSTFKFDMAMTSEFMEQILKGMLLKTLEVASDENRPKFEEFVNNCSIADIVGKYFMPGKVVVFRHGDYRASNLMHKYNKDGSITVVPIDYQTLQAGDPLTDLLYLVFCGSDRRFRAEHWTRLLDHYYCQLCAAMTRLGLDPAEIYSRETFDECVKEIMPYGLIVASTILQIVTVEEPPEVGKDSDIQTFTQMDHSELFRERLNGVLSDYIEWGIL